MESLDEMGGREELFFNPSVAPVKVAATFLTMPSEKEKERGNFRTGNMKLSLMLSHVLDVGGER